MNPLYYELIHSKAVPAQTEGRYTWQYTSKRSIRARRNEGNGNYTLGFVKFLSRNPVAMFNLSHCTVSGGRTKQGIANLQYASTKFFINLESSSTLGDNVPYNMVYNVRVVLMSVMALSGVLLRQKRVHFIREASLLEWHSIIH